MTFNPARMVDNLGNVRVGEVVAGNVSQLGPTVFVGLATLALPVVADVPLSFCSQQYVSTSPGFASVADPVSANGVLIGIV